MEEVEALEAALRSRKATERRHAVGRLAEYAAKSPKALNLLFYALEDCSGEVRHAAAESMRAAGAEICRSTPSLIPALTKKMGEEELSHRLLITKALRALGPPAVGAVPALMKALSDGEVEIRRQSVLVLVAIGIHSKPVQDELIRLTEDEDVDVRWTACYALHSLKLGGPKVAAALQRASKDENADIRKIARKALKPVVKMKKPRIKIRP
jgi:HEAT repeat protein